MRVEGVSVSRFALRRVPIVCSQSMRHREGDVVILKQISPPSMSDFDEILGEAHRQARQAGMKRSDIAAAVKADRAAS